MRENKTVADVEVGAAALRSGIELVLLEVGIQRALGRGVIGAVVDGMRPCIGGAQKQAMGESFRDGELHRVVG